MPASLCPISKYSQRFLPSHNRRLAECERSVSATSEANFPRCAWAGSCIVHWITPDSTEIAFAMLISPLTRLAIRFCPLLQVRAEPVVMLPAVVVEPENQAGASVSGSFTVDPLQLVQPMSATGSCAAPTIATPGSSGSPWSHHDREQNPNSPAGAGSKKQLLKSQHI